MYNEPGLPPGPDRAPALLAAILVKSLTIRGLIQTEFAADLMGELLERATPWVRDGSLKHKEDIVDGLETRRRHSRHAGRQELRQAPRPGELSASAADLSSPVRGAHAG